MYNPDMSYRVTRQPLGAAPQQKQERSTTSKLFGGFLVVVIGVGVALNFTNR